MSGADFIIVINLSVSGLLAAAFLALSVFEERREAARWFALSFTFGLFNFLFEFILPHFGGSLVVGLGAYAAFLGALGFLNVGLARLYGRRIPGLVFALLFLGGCAARLAIEGLPRDLLIRQLTYQLPYSLMQVAGMLLMWPARRRMIDDILLVALGFSALHFLVKPIMASASGGVGDSARAYSRTFYAMISQSSGTVLGLGVALLLFAVLVRDILEAFATRSETDALSGLLNRRGFEKRRDSILHRRPASGRPVSLVLCDLDGFKAVNDTHGHAAGDSVIIAFAKLLAASAADHYAVGRVGGEEFAIVLPTTNLSAARLFAENLRAAFSAATIPSFGPAERFTASFGVAEASLGETGAELQARTDAALYAAKRSGRDCVRAAQPQIFSGGRPTSTAMPKAVHAQD